MDEDFLIPIILFTITMSITPGPNNIMLTASGANFGFLRTIPHILGVVTGIAILNIFSTIGLSSLFTRFPYIQIILKYIGVIYMIFLAIKISRSSGLKCGMSNSKPINFLQAILFQALNPKAVIMSLTAISVYTIKGDLFYRSALSIILSFLIFGILSISVWALFGSFIKLLLSNNRNLKIFNYSLGGLCGISALLLII